MNAACLAPQCSTFPHGMSAPPDHASAVVSPSVRLSLFTMTPSTLNALVARVARNGNVADDVNRALSAAHSPYSNSQRLRLCKALFELILQSPTAPSSQYFSITISTIRQFSTSLKLSDGPNPLVETIAKLEKYTLKFALLIAEENDFPEFQKAALYHLQLSLKLLFDARAQQPAQTTTRKQRATPKAKRSLDVKENCNPQLPSPSKHNPVQLQPDRIQQLFEKLFFCDASKLTTTQLMPGDDSPLAARIICGALTFRLTSPHLDLSLEERIHAVRAVIFPWLRFLESSEDETNSEYTACFRERLSHMLRSLARKQPSTMVKAHANALALSLHNLSLEIYARDLTKSVLELVASKELGLMHQVTLNTVVTIYEDAVEYVQSNYDLDDPCWNTEEVSTWMDHVLHVLATINTRSLPGFFERRLSSASSHERSLRLSSCFELQLELFSLGAYSSSKYAVYDSGDFLSLARDPFWSGMQDLLSSLDFRDYLEESNELLNLKELPALEEESTVECVNEHIRLFQTIDPIRAIIFNRPTVHIPLLREVKRVLCLILSVTLTGLHHLSSVAPSGDQALGIVLKKLTIRMNRSISAALLSAKELMRLFWRCRDLTSMCNVISLVAMTLDLHSQWYSVSGGKWWKWFAGELTSFLDGARRATDKDSPALKEEATSALLSAIRHCEDVFTEYGTDADLSSDKLRLLLTCRGIHAARREWTSAAELSARIVYSLDASEPVQQEEVTSGVQDITSFSESARTFAKDLVRAASESAHDNRDSRSCVDVALKRGLKPGFLLGLMLEYHCHTRKSPSSGRGQDDHMEVVVSIQRVRAAILKIRVPGKLCSLARLHRLWLTFVLENRSVWSSKEGKDLLSDLKKKTNAQCTGHVETSFFGFKGGLSMCPSPKTYISRLVTVWRAVEDENFDGLEDELSELEEARRERSSGLSESSEYREMLLVSAEILEYAAFQLALHDYDALAAQAELEAEECRVTMGMPRTKNPFLRDLCTRTASSALFEQYYINRDDDESESVRRARLLFAKADYRSALKVAENEENEMPPHELALAVEEGSGDIISALVHTNKALKGALRRILTSQERIRHSLSFMAWSGAMTSIDLEIGGVNINLLPDSRVESGREHILFLIEFIGILFNFSRLLIQAENIKLGNYFLERCFSLARLCFPPTKFIFLTISSIYQDSTSDVMVRTKLEDEKNFVTKYNMFTTLSIAKHKAGGEISVACDVNRTPTKKPCGSTMSRMADMCELIVKERKVDNLEWYRKVTPEVPALKGIELSNADNSEKAVELLRSVVSAKKPSLRAGVDVCARYHYAKSLFMLQGAKSGCATPSAGRLSRSRLSRSRSRAALGRQKVDDAVAAIHEHLPADFSVPWILRRVYGLQMKRAGRAGTKSGVDVSLLSQRIGVSFNVRWRFLLSSKRQRQNGGTDGSSSSSSSVDVLFGQILIDDMARLIEALEENKVIVVGMNYDAGNLVVWRICSKGILLERRTLPEAAKFEKIKARLNEAVTVKGDRGQGADDPRLLTSKGKEAWWNEKYRQNDVVAEIVAEVESEWLGDAGYILDPSLGGGEEEGEELDNGHEVVLLLDTALERMPWECLGMLREKEVAVTRAPSMAFMEQHLREPVGGLDQDDLFYLINPTGEFGKTEQRLRGVLRAEWNGIQGVCTRSDVEAHYKNESIYLYCGHGTGAGFLSARRFEKTERAPVVLLMGCSSARADNVEAEDEESNGAAVDFLTHGSPAVVGALWDVSDGEIDRYTMSLVRKWAGAGEERGGQAETGSGGARGEGGGELVSLAKAAAVSRSACRLPYLVGAAGIVMGAPHVRVARASRHQ